MGLIGRAPDLGWGIRKGLLRTSLFGKSVLKDEFELFPSPATLGRLFNLSKPHFPHLKNGHSEVSTSYS